MGELKKRWFQVVWASLTLASLIINWLQRGSDAAWVHSAAMEMLNKVLMWILLPLTVVMFIALCIENWRTGERYFWRRWQRWGGALAVGIVMAVVLIFMVRYFKGDSGTIDPATRWGIIALFSFAALAWCVARWKFNNWRKE